MHKYIIGYGRDSIDVIEAGGQSAAELLAMKGSVDAGTPLQDITRDIAWAKPYTDDLAYELGWLDEPTERDVWRSQAPWR